MNVLITGANGFLGQHLVLYLAAKGYNVIACNRGECRIPQKLSFQYYSLDITNEPAVAAMIAAVQPDVVIHAAAMSKPDECNNNKEICLLHNVGATLFLLQSLRSVQSAQPHFIYISTDFIFGENGPHSEEDIATFVIDICKGIETIITQKKQGPYHLAGKDLLSPYQMAIAVADFLKLDAALIKNVTSDTFTEPVQRAKRSGLKIDKARTLLGYDPVGFEEGMQRTFNNDQYANSA